MAGAVLLDHHDSCQPQSRAWVTQLARTQNGTVPYSTSTLGTYGASTGSTSTKASHGSSALKLGRSGKTTGTTKTAGKTTGTTTAASHAKTKVAQVHYGVGVLMGGRPRRSNPESGVANWSVGLVHAAILGLS